MVCLQTTHCAILLSLLAGGRERVTEYSAPQWGQKKVPPSGIGSDRGTSAPPYTPNQATVESIADGALRERFASEGADPIGNTPQEFAAFMKVESARWATTVKAAGISLE
jgi:hypothetical protein